jgi:hypothetical protein
MFANMLWFGVEPAVATFAKIIDQVPASLVLTLRMYAENYFAKRMSRVVKPLGDVSRRILANALLDLNAMESRLEGMQAAVADLCKLAMRRRFAAQVTAHLTVYIDPLLFKMLVAIGDRSETVQDLPAALMGTRFAVVGRAVRLFM